MMNKKEKQALKNEIYCLRSRIKSSMAFNKKVIEVTEDPKILKTLQECQTGYEECLADINDIEEKMRRHEENPSEYTYEEFMADLDLAGGGDDKEGEE
jgi:hypothetical protein